MPKVTPSAVVDFLDASGLSREQRLTAQDVAVVSPLLDLLSRVPEASYQTLAPAEYVRLLIAMGILSGAFARWVNVDGHELSSSGGQPFIRNEAALKGAHPIAVLRDILQKCPDEAPAEHVPGLDFLKDAELAAVLRQDITTAHTALSNGEFKAACVMASSVVEALLLWGLKRKDAATPGAVAASVTAWTTATGAKPPSNPDPEHWTFYPLLNVARRIAPDPLLTNATANLAESMNEFRNLIHPGRAARLSLKPTLGMAHVAVGVMRQAADELAGLVAAGRL